MPHTHGRGVELPRARDLSPIYRALRDAGLAFRLADPVTATAQALIAFIPKDAPAPISPVAVQRLADERGTSPRTIHLHIRILIRHGLATDCCAGGGRRVVRRDSTGRITTLAGISFVPLLAQAETLAAKAAEAKAILEEHARLRADISVLRRQLKPMMVTASDAQRAIYAALPRRIASLAWDELSRIATILQRLNDALQMPLDPVEESDRSEISCRRSTPTTDPTSEPGNSRRPARQPERNDASPHLDWRHRSGLIHLTPDLLAKAAPSPWKRQLGQEPSWAKLAELAYGSAPSYGISKALLDQAHDQVGKHALAALVLIAIVNIDTIRNPAGWFRAMVRMTHDGASHLHRSVFGILNRAEPGASRGGDPDLLRQIPAMASGAEIPRRDFIQENLEQDGCGA